MIKRINFQNNLKSIIEFLFDGKKEEYVVNIDKNELDSKISNIKITSEHNNNLEFITSDEDSKSLLHSEEFNYITLTSEDSIAIIKCNEIPKCNRTIQKVYHMYYADGEDNSDIGKTIINVQKWTENINNRQLFNVKIDFKNGETKSFKNVCWFEVVNEKVNGTVINRYFQIRTKIDPKNVLIVPFHYVNYDDIEVLTLYFNDSTSRSYSKNYNKNDFDLNKINSDIQDYLDTDNFTAICYADHEVWSKEVNKTKLQQLTELGWDKTILKNGVYQSYPDFVHMLNESFFMETYFEINRLYEKKKSKKEKIEKDSSQAKLI